MAPQRRRGCDAFRLPTAKSARRSSEPPGPGAALDPNDQGRLSGRGPLHERIVREAGFDDDLVKPVEVEALEAAVRGATSRNTE